LDISLTAYSKIERNITNNGVNFTPGLPVVRTSPNHRTAYDIAGKNMASEESFRKAIYSAIDIFKTRQSYLEPVENPLKIRLQKRESDSYIVF